MHRLRLVVSPALGALVLALGPAGAAAFTVPDASPAVWHVVVLGDSGANGSGDPTRLAWGGRYGQLLQARLRLKVAVTNLAQEGKSTGDLLQELRSSSSTRAALKAADVILFGSTSGHHLNEADDNVAAKSCRPEACYTTALRAWSLEFRKVVAVATAFRAGKKTVIRGVTDPNVVPGAQGIVPPFLTPKLGQAAG